MSKHLQKSKTGKRKTAVALKYDGQGAPKVTAKGSGHLAEQILKLAQAHQIPIQQEHELVELLAQIELEQEIPEALFEAVAQILAFAYQISQKPVPHKHHEQP